MNNTLNNSGLPLSCVYTHNFKDAMAIHNGFYILDKEDMFENVDNAISKNHRARLDMTFIIEVSKPQTRHRISVDVFPLNYYDYIILNCKELDTDTIYEYWKILDGYKKEGYTKHLGVRNISQNTLENLFSLAKLHKLFYPSLYILDAVIPATRAKIIQYCFKNNINIYLVNKLNLTNDKLKEIAIEKECLVKDIIASRIMSGGIGLLSYFCIDFKFKQLSNDEMNKIDDALMEALV